ncbi:MAG TPA: tetratricopeptide repeat protein [Terracidiphilus sp.]|nr:tetratricopeptide repeat protein [Terracidiphilus sp.]
MRKQAESGYVDQQIALAAAYFAGRGVPQDFGQSAHWYEKAAQAGSPEAQNQIGYFYQQGIGVPVDMVRAVHWFQLASAAGMRRAKVNLGVSYLNGEGVRKNPAMARKLFEEALDKGLGLAATYLGDMDYFGVGVPVDKAAGEKWFEQGAKLHDPESAYNLGDIYFQGEGHAHDMARAAELLRFSAAKGYVPAKHLLGLLLVNHRELAQSDQEAHAALREASDAGSWKASVLLGVLARDARGGGANRSLAYYYFHLAALQCGDSCAKVLAHDVKMLEEGLSREERAAQATQAEAFFEKHRQQLMFVYAEKDQDPDFPMAAVADPAARP